MIISETWYNVLGRRSRTAVRIGAKGISGTPCHVPIPRFAPSSEGGRSGGNPHKDEWPETIGRIFGTSSTASTGTPHLGYGTGVQERQGGNPRDRPSDTGNPDGRRALTARELLHREPASPRIERFRREAFFWPHDQGCGPGSLTIPELSSGGMERQAPAWRSLLGQFEPRRIFRRLVGLSPTR